MRLTRAADYAVRVMIHLAGLKPGTRVTRSALAQAANVPEDFIGKVLQALVRARLVFSHRGALGGFELACAADRTSLLEVIEAIEGPVALNYCLVEGQTCEREGWCAAHFVWIDAQEAMTSVLRRAMLADLARESKARLSTLTVTQIQRAESHEDEADRSPGEPRV